MANRSPTPSTTSASTASLSQKARTLVKSSSLPPNGFLRWTGCASPVPPRPKLPLPCPSCSTSANPLLASPAHPKSAQHFLAVRAVRGHLTKHHFVVSTTRLHE